MNVGITNYQGKIQQDDHKPKYYGCKAACRCGKARVVDKENLTANTSLFTYVGIHRSYKLSKYHHIDTQLSLSHTILINQT